MDVRDVITIIREVGIIWILCRILYALKLRMLSAFPLTEKLFAKKVVIRDIDLFDYNAEAVESSLRGLPKERKEEIIQIANDVLAGKVLAFSSEKYEYGNPIDWHLNPLTGKRYDAAKKWYLLPDFDKEYGDIKATWELNRFSHVWHLCRAYILTKDNKYFDAFQQQVESWMEENRYSFGPNFKCGQECSLRMMNVLVATSVFRHYGMAEKGFLKQVAHFVQVNYKKIRSNFFYARYCVKTDHLISELCGQVTGAWCSGNPRLAQKYLKILDRQIREQFNDAGLYQSYSFNYQRYVLQLIEYMLPVAAKCRFEFSEKSKSLLVRAASVYVGMANGEGNVPNYGANDGTLIFPCGKYEDYRPTANAVIYLLTGRKIYDDPELAEEISWFQGKMSVKKNDSLMQGGHTAPFLYSSSENCKAYMNAHPYERRPGHMDQLHVDVWVFGKNVFVDSGTYSYTEGIGDALRKTRGHNTVSLQGKEQMKCLGRFLVYGKPKILSRVQRQQSMECEERFYTGYTHKRTVTNWGDGFVVSDQVDVSRGNWDGTYSVLFHTPFEVRLVDGSQCHILVGNNQKIFLRSNSAGRIKVNQTYMSSHYLDKKKINEIEIISAERGHETVMGVVS